MQSRDSILYGNLTFVARIASGSGVITTLTLYGGASLGWGFSGDKKNTASLTIGSIYASATLPFDATAGFHRYSILWAPSSVVFLADDAIVYQHQGPEVPSSSLPIWGFLYACGASWCSPFTYTGPESAALAAIAWTPLNGTAAATCTNPPLPPAFCDQGATVASLWTPQTACLADMLGAPQLQSASPSQVGFCASHAVATAQGIDLLADTNISCYLPGDCRGHAAVATAQIQSPSYIQRGLLHVQMQAPSLATWVASLRLTDGVRILEWNVSGSSSGASTVSVDGKLYTVVLPFPAASAMHTYHVGIGQNNVSFAVDSASTPLAVFPLATALPRLPLYISLLPLTNTVDNSSLPTRASLASITYTPEGGSPASWGASAATSSPGGSDASDKTSSCKQSSLDCRMLIPTLSNRDRRALSVARCCRMRLRRQLDFPT